MLKDTNRTRIIISFSIAVLFIALVLNECWGIITNTDESMGRLPLLYTIIAIIALSNLFRLAYKLADKNSLEEYVNQKVAESNSKIINEFKEKEKLEEYIEEEARDDSDVKAKECLPSGNFKKIDTFARKFLVNLADVLNLTQGIVYLSQKDSDSFEFCAGYALPEDQKPENFKLGENLTGEAAKEQQIAIINEIPAEYFNVESGLGSSKPGSLTIVPIISNNKTIAVMELATFSDISDKKLKVLEKIAVLGAAKIEQIVKS